MIVAPNWSDPYLKVRVGKHRGLADVAITDRRGIPIMGARAANPLQAIRLLSAIINELHKEAT